jgi:hypothetical protein
VENMEETCEKMTDFGVNVAMDAGDEGGEGVHDEGDHNDIEGELEITADDMR